MQQIASIFSRLQKKNVPFSSISDDFIELWSDKLKQWTKFVVTLGNLQESFYTFLYMHIYK